MMMMIWKIKVSSLFSVFGCFTFRSVGMCRLRRLDTPTTQQHDDNMSLPSLILCRPFFCNVRRDEPCSFAIGRSYYPSLLYVRPLESSYATRSARTWLESRGGREYPVENYELFGGRRGVLRSTAPPLL